MCHGRRWEQLLASSPQESDLVSEEPSIRPTPLSGEAIEGKLIKLKDFVFLQVFPIFYFYYDNHPVGTATLFNPLEESVTDVTVSLFVNQYMDAPKEYAAITEFAAGADEQGWRVPNQ